MTWFQCTSDARDRTKYARLVRQTMPIVIVGTVAWIITLIIEISISAKDTSIWISLVGIGLGVMGTAYLMRGLRKKNIDQPSI